MSAQLDSTFGAAFIGMVIAAVLYGISCVQALYYYTYQNDRWYTKLIVTAVMIFDTVHQALIAHTVYTYTVTGWGDPVQLGLIVWSLVAEVIFEGITAFIVQTVLTTRIWRLSHGNIYLTGIPMILALGGFITIVLNVAAVPWFHLKTMADLAKTKDFTIALTVLNVTCDLLITAILCTLLNTSRTGFQRSEVIVNRLIVFTVNTGLITSICAVGCLIALLVAGDTFIYIAFFFCLGRLYTNTLLATFNARNSIRKPAEMGSTDLSLQLNVHKKVSNQTPNITITIDTNTEMSPGSDQKLEENLKLPYDEESGNKVPY